MSEMSVRCRDCDVVGNGRQVVQQTGTVDSSTSLAHHLFTRHQQPYQQPINQPHPSIAIDCCIYRVNPNPLVLPAARQSASS